MGFGRFALWPTFFELRKFPIRNFLLIDSTYGLLSILRFKTKSDSRNSNKFRSKLEKNAKSQFLGCENILSSAAVTMG